MVLQLLSEQRSRHPAACQHLRIPSATPYRNSFHGLHETVHCADGLQNHNILGNDGLGIQLESARCDSIACCRASNRGVNLSPCRSRVGPVDVGREAPSLRPLNRLSRPRQNQQRPFRHLLFSVAGTCAIAFGSISPELSWPATIAFMSQSGSPSTCCLCTSKPNCSNSEKLKPCNCLAELSVRVPA